MSLLSIVASSRRRVGAFDPLDPEWGAELIIDPGLSMLNAAASPAVLWGSVAEMENQSVIATPGSSATQAVEASRPKALPHDGSNFLALPGVNGNYARTASGDGFDGLTDFSIEVSDVIMPDWTPSPTQALSSKYNSGSRAWILRINNSGIIQLLLSYTGFSETQYSATEAHGIPDGSKASIRVVRSGTDLTFWKDVGAGFVQVGDPVTTLADPMATSSQRVETGSFQNGSVSIMKGSVGGHRVWDNASPDSTTPLLDIDFAEVEHGASEFYSRDGRLIEVQTSGDNPAKVMGYPVARTDGADDFLSGTFPAGLSGGRVFMVVDVNGGGGEASGRIYSESQGTLDTDPTGIAFGMNSGGVFASYYAGGVKLAQAASFSGRVILEVLGDPGTQRSVINGGAPVTDSDPLGTLETDSFAIAGQSATGDLNTALDVLYIYRLPEGSTDELADRAYAYFADRFGITGKPPLVLTASNFDDTRTPVDHGTHIETSPVASVTLQTNTTSLEVTLFRNTTATFDELADVGVLIDGVWNQSIRLGADTGEQVRTITLPAGDKTVELVNGATTTPVIVSQGSKGTWLKSLIFNNGSGVVQNVTPTDRRLFYGDSICVGDAAYDGGEITRDSYINLVRSTHFPNSIACEGWGSRTLKSDAETSQQVTSFVATLAEYSAAQIILTIGTNDYGLNQWSAADFGVAYAAVLDEIASVMPGTPVLCVSPVIRSSEAPNGLGSTLDDYRTEISSACSGRAWATYYEGKTIMTTGDLTDGVHPNAGGHLKFANAMIAALGI